MPVEWTASDIRLLVSLDRPAGALRGQLERAIRESIHSGRLRSGERLPPSRQLATHLGVSRGLVTDCYAQLAAEGYLTSRAGSPTRVAAAAGVVHPPVTAATAERAAPAIDFRPTVPDLSRFPRRDWSWALTQACRTAPSPALDYSLPQGDPGLRATVAGYLRRVRGAAADPANLVICGGFTQGLGLVLGALSQAGIDQIAVEEPGPTYREIVTARVGSLAVPVPVDGEGIDVPALTVTGVRAVVLTPAHQSPTGVVLTARRRHAMVEWARAANALIIEDDYDAEFRYDRNPVGTVQGLAPDRVILVGTVSKSLAPALRLGWVLAPPQLVAAITAGKRFDDRAAPLLDQLALAALINSGRFDRHLRAMRKLYAARRQHLVTALSKHAPAVRVTGLAAGLHAVAQLPAHLDETEVVATALACGIGLHPMSDYRLHAHSSNHHPQLVLGYGHLTESTIDQGIATVADIIHG
jgi:GntR family transcriptional regulator/MocR family aminotransferase